MNNAWQHVEALQTTDLSGLLEHISNVIQGGLEASNIIEKLAKENDLHQRQEILVFYYLNSILKKMEENR